jgi:hypothetical protein
MKLSIFRRIKPITHEELELACYKTINVLDEQTLKQYTVDIMMENITDRHISKTVYLVLCNAGHFHSGPHRSKRSAKLAMKELKQHFPTTQYYIASLEVADA